MILTVLGCSGSVPGPASPCSGYLVEHDGYRLLLDLGTGAFGTLLAHAAPADVDAVVVSHQHGDHLADLASLAYAQEKLGPRATPTRVIAPAGTARLVRRSHLLAFEDAHPGDLRCGPFLLRLARVRHSVETYAVRVESGGASLTYTGDSGPCRELARLARGTGVLLAEAASGPGDGPGEDPDGRLARGTGVLLAEAARRPGDDLGDDPDGRPAHGTGVLLPEAARGPGDRPGEDPDGRLARGTGVLLAEAARRPGDDLGDGPGAEPDPAAPHGWGLDHTAPAPHHLTARQAGELAAAAGAGLLVVTHLRPWDDAGRCLAAAAVRFPGPVLLARPGLRLAAGRPPHPPHSEEET